MTPPDDIRSLVALLVREQINVVIRQELAELTGGAPTGGAGPELGAAAPVASRRHEDAHAGPDVSTVSTSRARRRGARVEQVSVTSDAELNSFARRLLLLFDNPQHRDDLRQGRLTFRLSSPPHGSTSVPGTTAGPDARRIDSGVVSERVVVETARNGTALVVGPGVIVTPLALDKARSLNVHIERGTR